MQYDQCRYIFVCILRFVGRARSPALNSVKAFLKNLGVLHSVSTLSVCPLHFCRFYEHTITQVLDQNIMKKETSHFYVIRGLVF